MRNIIKKLIVGSLLTVSVLGVFATGCKKTTANIPASGNEEPLKPIESPVTDGDGNELYENKVYSLPRNMVFFSPSLMSAETEQEVTVKAIITPDSATDKTVDWSVAFKNSESEWATGKTVTDYVTVTPVSDGSLTAKVSNLQAFGEQIILTCTSRSNTSIKATCTVDFKQSYVKELVISDNIGETSYNLSNGETPIIHIHGIEAEGAINIKYSIKSISTVYTISTQQLLPLPAKTDKGMAIECSDVWKNSGDTGLSFGLYLTMVKVAAVENTESEDVAEYSLIGLFDKTNSLNVGMGPFKSQIKAKSSRCLQINFKDDTGSITDSVVCDIDYSAWA